MIERKLVKEKFLEYKITEFLFSEFNDVPIESVALEKTPFGERIVIRTSIPGLIIGSKGSNINNLTKKIAERFNLENPQIKILDSKNPNLSANIIARKIVSSLKRFGSMRFKLIGYKTVDFAMKAGAVGIEVVLSGKIPSSRAKSWRFVGGYIKKTGYASDYYIDKTIDSVCLKTGVIGIKVAVMTKDVPLPQKVDILKEKLIGVSNNEVIDVEEGNKEDIKVKKDEKDEIENKKDAESILRTKRKRREIEE